MARTRLSVDLPESLARATRVEAARRGTTISHFTALALEAAVGGARDASERRREAAARTLELAKRATRVASRRPVHTDELVLAERERS